MPWYFDPSESSFDLYDPSGATVATGLSFDGGWSGDTPTEVYVEAMKYIGNEIDANNISAGTAFKWTGELIADDIEEGVAP